MDKSFDWDSDPALTIRRKRGLIVLPGKGGRVVIRQEGAHACDDHVVSIDLGDVALVIQALESAAKQARDA
jgi:hypothetical protein